MPTVCTSRSTGSADHQPPIWQKSAELAQSQGAGLAGHPATVRQVVDFPKDSSAGNAGTALDTSWGMKTDESRLVRHLALAVVVKLLVLVLLWWVFVRTDRVGIDIERAAAHIGATAMPSAPTGETP